MTTEISWLFNGRNPLNFTAAYEVRKQKIGCMLKNEPIENWLTIRLGDG